MNSIDLSIIIINWKSQAFVKGCLASIADTIGDLTHEILVVDNASFDGCKEMVREHFPDVIFIQSERNLGFSGANNLAFSRSRGHNILFLNPDTEVRPKALQRLVATLEDLHDAGMVGARLLNSDFSLQTTCISAVPSILNQTLNAAIFRKAFPRWQIWGMRALYDPASEPVSVQAISGACMIGRRSVFEQVGAFSTDYFMYAEDMDLCVKVTGAGWTVYYDPKAEIVHHAGGSSSSRTEENFSDLVLRESLVRYFVKHRGITYAALYRASLAILAVIRMLLLVIASPVLILQSRRPYLGEALNKWRRILIWSIGLTGGRRRGQPEQQSRSFAARA